MGAHSLRFGATVTRVEMNQYWDQYPGGAWIFADLSGDTIPGTPLGGSMYGDPIAVRVRGRPQLQLYDPERAKLIPSTPTATGVRPGWTLTSRTTGKSLRGLP